MRQTDGRESIQCQPRTMELFGEKDPPRMEEITNLITKDNRIPHLIMSINFIIKRADNGEYLARVDCDGPAAWTSKWQLAHQFNHELDNVSLVKRETGRKFNCKIEVEDLLAADGATTLYVHSSNFFVLLQLLKCCWHRELRKHAHTAFEQRNKEP